MRNNQLEQALLRAGYVKHTSTKPKKQTHVPDVHESTKPEWDALPKHEQHRFAVLFNASS